MSETKIVYDPRQSTEAGYWTLTPSSSPPLEARHRKTLLNLLFWLTYTDGGREFLRENRMPDKSEDEVRKALRARFVDDYGIIDEGLLGALIDGHIAAVRWTLEDRRMPDVEAKKNREHWERVYQHNLAFIMWSLWEDAMGIDFSMVW